MGVSIYVAVAKEWMGKLHGMDCRAICTDNVCIAA